MTTTNCLWQKNSTTDDEKKQAHSILEKSIHRVDDRRVNHLSTWIRESPNPVVSLKFINDNIDCKDFHPFANPWDKDEIKNIFKTTNGTKLLRLSTRSPGELTMSSIIGIDSSKRFNITADGIILGNFKFQGVADLMTHMNSQCCCVCLDNIDNLESIALKCGHILHQSCYESNVLYSNQCPLSKIVAKESFLIHNGL